MIIGKWTSTIEEDGQVKYKYDVSYDVVKYTSLFILAYLTGTGTFPMWTWLFMICPIFFKESFFVGFSLLIVLIICCSFNLVSWWSIVIYLSAVILEFNFYRSWSVKYSNDPGWETAKECIIRNRVEDSIF